VLVALSYPKAFAIRPSPNAFGSLVRGEDRGGAGGVGSGNILFDCGSFGVGFSLYGWGGCGLYEDSSLGYAPYRFAPYAYSPFFYGGTYGGWYVGNEPFVISLQPSNATATHGQVVNGRGYVEGGRADQGTASQSSAPSSSATSTPASSGSSSSTSGSSGGGSSSGGSERTAQPR